MAEQHLNKTLPFCTEKSVLVLIHAVSLLQIRHVNTYPRRRGLTPWGKFPEGETLALCSPTIDFPRDSPCPELQSELCGDLFAFVQDRCQPCHLHMVSLMCLCQVGSGPTNALKTGPELTWSLQCWAYGKHHFLF